jgi:hypothetical protein
MVLVRLAFPIRVLGHFLVLESLQQEQTLLRLTEEFGVPFGVYLESG